MKKDELELIAKALGNIVHVDRDSILLQTKEHAVEISDILRRAGNGGVMTGPFYTPNIGYYYSVSKNFSKK